MKTRPLKFEVRLVPCRTCKGAHAHWWLTSTAAPPSCAERVRRMQGG